MIRQITTLELLKIQDLAFAIWPSAYKEILSKEQLDYMLNRFYSLEALKEQLETKKHVFYIAEDENKKPLGFVSYELDCEPQKTKIHKIYVLPETQGTGVGKKLFQLVKDKAILGNQSAVFLNVNKYNNAKEFYQKLNFSIVREEVIDIGYDYVMDDYVMEVSL